MVDINTSDGAVLEALNNKADVDLNNRLANIDFVVESFQAADGTSWYRKYASGWMEQGGTIFGLSVGSQFNLPVPFKKAYTITGNYAGTSNFTGTSATGITTLYPVNLSQFYVRTGAGSQNGNVTFFACGQ